MREFKIFNDTIKLLGNLSFEFFDTENIEELYTRFRYETVGKYHEVFDNYADDGIKQLLFRYFGYDTKYGFKLSIEIPVCKQIWTYVPYIDDNIEYDDHFHWINGQLERVLGEELPISNIEHQKFGFKETVKFLYDNQEINVTEENLTLLSCEYILQVNKLLKTKNRRNRYLHILDYGSIEDVLFSCKKESLEKLIRFFDIDQSRIQ